MNFNSLIPELIVSDLERSKRFYVDLLSFEIEYERLDEKFVFLSHEGTQLMLLEDNSSEHSRTGKLDYPRGQGVNFSLRIEKLDMIADSLSAAEYSLQIPIREQWHRQDDVLHGERQLWVMDPDGYLLRFVQSLGVKPAIG
jgi:lactoylglutathione lyase